MDKGPAQQLTPRQHIDRFTALHHIQMQRGALQFLYWAYGFLLVTTMLIILFQGFRVGGFALDASFLKWLGAVTLGEVGGLAATVYGALFRRK
jgi:hypothetical protein